MKIGAYIPEGRFGKIHNELDILLNKNLKYSEKGNILQNEF